ncbi:MULTISPECIES: MarR family winged helix-turn-helix transcriptional regulator [Phyllobacteriaceae]|jgi:DNA-binding MarR family transcriptional regulator|uniref:Transcriptional regulator n=1 Tax=Mesorhizobium hungaricum TaxID=1566387 RepID=A0A1C2DJF3_9HYPH|nr:MULTISPECIES: MarR family transcriptional regulator [Mesorhizobium]MBN9233300.1 MarR family transcriptional regulator [Mesorhizobium sp.]MDQ0332011.1 DNA-binding MarR family transcriptional regulator [Mesorhizobium sp. YL-MeA3-2017]OCX14892.1 transcriptional regulator [Mesorhizobium hungaricum]
MVEDVVRDLGYLTLGSRFRRIGEQLQSEVQRILDRAGAAIPSSQFPALAAIDRLGPLTIGDLAEALGMTQPGATRIATQLAEAGLIDIRQGKDDQRRKIASLSEAGQNLVETSKRDLWPHIERAVAEVCAPLTGPLLQQLAAIERDLEAIPLHRRVANRLGQDHEQTSA